MQLHLHDGVWRQHSHQTCMQAAAASCFWYLGSKTTRCGTLCGLWLAARLPQLLWQHLVEAGPHRTAPAHCCCCCCCHVTFLQVLALAAVRATPVLTQRCRDIISTNLAIADGFFARWREVFDWQPPQASISTPSSSATVNLG